MRTRFSFYTAIIVDFTFTLGVDLISRSQNCLILLFLFKETRMCLNINKSSELFKLTQVQLVVTFFE